MGTSEETGHAFIRVEHWTRQAAHRGQGQVLRNPRRRCLVRGQGDEDIAPSGGASRYASRILFTLLCKSSISSSDESMASNTVDSLVRVTLLAAKDNFLETSFRFEIATTSVRGCRQMCPQLHYIQYVQINATNETQASGALCKNGECNVITAASLRAK